VRRWWRASSILAPSSAPYCAQPIDPARRVASHGSLTLDELDQSEDTERLGIGDVTELVGHYPSQTNGVSLIPPDPIDEAPSPRGAGADDDPAVRNTARRSVLATSGPELATQARVCMPGVAPIETDKVTGFWCNLELKLDVIDEPEGTAPIATLAVAQRSHNVFHVPWPEHEPVSWSHAGCTHYEADERRAPRVERIVGCRAPRGGRGRSGAAESRHGRPVLREDPELARVAFRQLAPIRARPTRVLPPRRPGYGSAHLAIVDRCRRQRLDQQLRITTGELPNHRGHREPPSDSRVALDRRLRVTFVVVARSWGIPGCCQRREGCANSCAACELPVCIGPAGHLDHDIQQLIVRLAAENRRWGYQRIKGEHRGIGRGMTRPSITGPYSYLA
jgi:hypothetical protein